MSLVCLDLETTGFKPHSAGIVEIGAVLVRDGVIVGEGFSTLAWPGYEMVSGDGHWKALEKNQVPLDQLKDAPRVADAMEQLARWLDVGDGGRVAVTSFNVAFDRPFLEAAAPWACELLDWQECLMQRAQRHLGLARSPSLARACEMLGIARDGEHRALADAQAAARIWLALEGR